MPSADARRGDRIYLTSCAVNIPRVHIGTKDLTRARDDQPGGLQSSQLKPAIGSSVGVTWKWRCLPSGCIVTITICPFVPNV